MPTRGLMRNCQPPARQELPGGIERGKSVPGQEDGKTKAKKKVARMLPSASVGMRKNSAVVSTLCGKTVPLFPHCVEVVGNGAQVDPRAAIQVSLGKTT